MKKLLARLLSVTWEIYFTENQIDGFLLEVLLSSGQAYPTMPIIRDYGAGYGRKIIRVYKCSRVVQRKYDIPPLSLRTPL